jgi:hypothetical protein
MKIRLCLLFLVLTLGGLAPRASALMTFHGREAIRSSGWSDGLAAIVNHPARVCGEIGPFGPASRFHFSGDTAVFNQILTQYAALPQKPLVIYLQAGRAPGVKGFKPDETHDFDLQISIQSEGFLYLYSQSRVRLEDLQIPASVAVEVCPAVLVPVDPKERAELEAEQKRLSEFVARRNAQGTNPDPKLRLKNTR